MSDPFAGLEPAGFWGHFAALTRIPRPSHGEGEVAAHVLAWAAGRGLPARRDAAGNLAVDVPATPGREAAPVVTLQGHLDMVCEREPGSPHDPRTGPVPVVRDGDWIAGDGTTLGADDGVAIAAMLATAEDAGAPHGPLELLMTVAEEVGLQGAQLLDPALVTGDLLLNLDSEEDATLTVGCAGSADAVLRLAAPREAPPAGAAGTVVSVGGLRGGHSGGDIALGRANAIKLLGRVLAAAPGVRLAALDGGASRNAIPRDARAVCLTGDAGRAALAAAAAAERAAYERTEPGLTVALEDGGPAPAAWSAADTGRILDLLAVLPAGPLGVDPEFPAAVQTSSSVGVAQTAADGTLTVHTLSRSADDATLAAVLAGIAAAARLAGAAIELPPAYRAWRPDPGSPLLATAIRVHTALFGAEPAVTVTHGGLETALIGAKRPGLPMLSLGPTIRGAHAPGEALRIPSAARFMRLLGALLDELSR